MAGIILCMGLAILYAALVVRAIRQGEFRRRPMQIKRDWTVPFAVMLTWSRQFERLQPMLQRPAMALAVLEGGRCTPERLLQWTAEGVATGCAVAFGASLLSVAAGNPPVGWVGLLLGAAIPMLRARDLFRQVERRKLSMLMELPVLLSRLLVLVNAGENVRPALARCLESGPAKRHPLYVELAAALKAMERGESMFHALEEFGRRCAVPETKLFAAVLFMNARRGGEELVSALRDLARQMWDKRKAVARTLGEQASSRLAFPLAVIFLLIIVMVGAPALLFM